MSGFEGLLAAIIIIQSAVQLVVLYLLFRIVARLAERTDRLLNRVEPQLDDLATGIRAIRDAAEFTRTELRATMATVRGATEELDRFTRDEAAEIGRVLGKATALAERQLYHVDETLDATRGRMLEVALGFDQAILEPARTVLAVATGVKRAIGKLVAPRSRDRTDGLRNEPDGHRDEPDGDQDATDVAGVSGTLA